jgi:hypothetical protein
VGDLEIRLLDCNGADLSIGNGGSGSNFSATIFDNNASQSIQSIVAADAPFTGSYTPISSINCNGLDPNGTWTLEVNNTSGSATGTIDSWSLVFHLGDVEHCNDGLDNDGDGDIDCTDSGCSSNVLCGGSSNPEDCNNQGDEDGNGFADCADASCDGLAGPNGQTCENPFEFTCDDGADNDGDGGADCADPDGDCSTDPSCTNETNSNPNSICVAGNCPNCDDGNDNDGNGTADCGSATDSNGDPYAADPNCEAIPGVCGGNTGGCDLHAGEEAADGSGCDDGCDNDGDGLIDCDDEDCCVGPNSACNLPTQCLSTSGEVCDNGLDDDGDGLIDCDDGPDCNPSTAPTICLGNEGDAAGGTCNGSTCTQCHDCSDSSGNISSCFEVNGQPTTPDAGGAILSSVYTIPVDNDQDGLANCDDDDCNNDPALCPPPVTEGNINCHGGNVGQCPECYDGLDNDSDGTGGSSGFTGAWLGTIGNMIFDANAPIADGADCFDDTSITCADDTLGCRACVNDAACLACATDAGCEAGTPNWDPRAATVLDSCYFMRASDTGNECPN